MRIPVALAVVAVLGGGTALAADSPHPTTTATPSGAKATPVKQSSLKACNKRADAKNLTGPQRAAFVKNCRTGKGGTSR
jgi:hypothetical protein